MQIFQEEMENLEAVDLYRNLFEPVSDSFLGKSLTRPVVICRNP